MRKPLLVFALLTAASESRQPSPMAASWSEGKVTTILSNFGKHVNQQDARIDQLDTRLSECMARVDEGDAKVAERDGVILELDIKLKEVLQRLKEIEILINLKSSGPVKNGSLSGGDETGREGDHIYGTLDAVNETLVISMENTGSSVHLKVLHRGYVYLKKGGKRATSVDMIKNCNGHYGGHYESPCALHQAARDGDVDEIRWLLESGDSVNRLATSSQLTPLYYASQQGHLAVAKLLLENGTDVNLSDGATPLHAASEKGHLEMASLLIEKGSDVDRTTSYSGSTPLHKACENGHLAVARMLIERGADVNAAQQDGNSPLQLAIEKGHLSLAQLLAEKGADVNKENSVGKTLLHVACEKDLLDAVELLLKNGADKRKKDSTGKIPLDLVKVSRKNEFRQLFAKF